MCGIAGISTKQEKRVTKRDLKNAAAALAHRGPDGEGFFTHQNVGLVHRRLSIIDLSGGSQPLFGHNKPYVLVANGEIYNYKTLQKQAKADGVKLQTGSDCEPILHLYHKHGIGFVEHIEGMVALALYDTLSGDLILYRDPFGIKPLYYAETDKGFYFASEPQALSAAGWVEPKENTTCRAALLNRQYVGGEETLWHGIKRLGAGEVIRVREGHIVARSKHSPLLKMAQKLTEAEAMEGLENHLMNAVQSHVQADVPYGAFLSGGIDSSAMVTTMQKIVEDNQLVRTFTIGFESSTVNDERTDAEALAEALKTKHSSINFGEKDFWAYFAKHARFMDDPVADYAALPLFKLAEHASKQVKVVLSGEGGDEMFAGYGRYRPNWWDILRGKTLRGSGDAAAFAHIIGEETARWREKQADIPSHFTALQRAQAQDIADWLPDDLLTKVDRCLMAYGLEGRVPYLDNSLATFAFALPDGLKVQGKHGKWLLKQWLSDNAPVDVWRKKRGFTVPVRAWLNKRQPDLATYFKNNEAIQQACNGKALTTLLEKPLEKKAAKFIFNLLTYAAWHETHIQRRRFSLKINV